MTFLQKLKLLGKGSSYELTNTLLAEVARGNLDSVIKLVTNPQVNKKISYRFRDDNGDCVLHVAVRNNHQDIARIMLELAPDTASRKNKKTGETPLHMAVKNRAVDLIRVLINYHAKMEVFYDGRTPLMQAADSGHTECVSALLQYGASKMTVDRHGRKAFDYAKTSEDKELLRPSQQQPSADGQSTSPQQGEYLISTSRSEEYDEDTRGRLPVQDQYKLGPRIGEGAYAASYIAKNVRYHFECVLKALAANNLDDINDSLAEGLTLALFKDCRRVIRFNDFFISLPDKIKTQPFNQAVRVLTTTKRIKPGSRQGTCVVNLAMEWAKGGDVFTLVSNRLLQAADEEERLEREMYERQMEDASFESKDSIFVEPVPFTEDEVCRLVSQICEALVDIHSCHFIHRDIKPGNLFMDESDNVMLGDFGIAKFFEENYRNSAPAHTVVGSQNYMASEMHDTSKPYTRAVDIFAVGCVIYFLVKFNHPNFFMKDARAQVLPEMKGSCSNFVFQLTERMWDPVAELRPSAKEVLDWIERRQVGPRRALDPQQMQKEPAPMTPEMEENLKKQKKVPLRRRYAVGKLISSGNHMYKARHIYTRKKYVMKRMPCDSLTEVNERLQEAAHLAHLRRSKHVVWFQDMFLDLTLKRELDETLDTKNNETCDDRLSVCIVMQYCAGGDLGEYIQNYVNDRGDDAYLPEERVLRWILNAGCGLRDIHQASVIHRNIGMDNLFLTKDLELLLGEFGSAKDVRTFGEARTMFQGASEFQAPELQAMNSDQGSYTSSVDVFSLGVVLYQLLTLQPPSFGGMPDIPHHYTDFVRNLAAQMVSPNPSDRPTTIQLVKMIEQDLKRDPRRGQDMNGGGMMMGQQRRSAANSGASRMVSPSLSPGYGNPQYPPQGGRGAARGGRGGRPSNGGGGGRPNGRGGGGRPSNGGVGGRPNGRGGGGQSTGVPGYPRRRPPVGGVAVAGMQRQGSNPMGNDDYNRTRQNSAPRGGMRGRGGPPRGGGGGGRGPRAPGGACLACDDCPQFVSNQFRATDTCANCFHAHHDH